MMTRIKALVAAGLNIELASLGTISTKVFAVVISDPRSGSAEVAGCYGWQHGGDIDATIEAAVAKAERYLVERDGLTDEARIERALAVDYAEVD